jgi:hypothetical protein
MPANLRASAEAAKARHRDRFSAPPFEMRRDDNGVCKLVCPYGEEDRDNWQALLFDAFGTRSLSVINTFLSQLSALCGMEWNPDDEMWSPKLQQLNTAIAVVASAQPENELQACIAAQMVALHFTAMKLGGVMGGHSVHPDERTASSLARVSKAYANLARTMAQLQGKNSSRHDMFVTYIDNRQQAFMGGGQNFGGQPHAHRETSVASEYQSGPCLAALPSPCPDKGRAMPGAGGQGQERVPNAWRRILRSALGRG